MRIFTFILFFLSLTPIAHATESPVSPFTRSYSLGETIHYLMTGRNQIGSETHSYSAVSSATVQKEDAGIFYEDAAWSDLKYDGQSVALDADSLAFRQQVSLDTKFESTSHQPKQEKLDRRLLPPSDDLMNIYVDLQLAAKFPNLRKSGDHFYFKYGVPVKYENGQAETCIDFDLTVRSLDEKNGIATINVKHVPPKMACVGLPSAWMQMPIESEIPNVVQTIPNSDGSFEITVGREIIDVDLQIQLGNGKILGATLTDSFDLVERRCADNQGAKCDAPNKQQQQRIISLKPLP